MANPNPKDVLFMQMALREAERGRGHVHPNPLVGAVLVLRGKVIARGAHLCFGQAHAEVNALRSLGSIPRQAVLYTTLEPCSHTGKTPPCTEWLIQKKLKNVVVGMKDPNPLVSGRGIRALKKSGARVAMSAIGDQCEYLNRDFKKWIQRNIPYVTVKAAQTLDGKIASFTGASKWITGPDAREKAHRLRHEADAVLVGIGTVSKDDPRLNIRLKNVTRHPVKVVLDSMLKISPKAKLFSGTSADRVYLFTSARSAHSKRAVLARKAQVVVVPEKKEGRLDWQAILSFLGKRGIVHVLIEGGGDVIGSALREKIADEAAFFMAPKILGGRKALSSVSGDGFATPAEALKLKKVTVEKLGEDLLVRGIF